MNKPQFIIVHHSVSPKDVPWVTAERSFNNNHKARFNFRSSLGWYIGYQYVIYGNGELKQYRRDNEEGAHCKEQGMNFKSLGVCLSGNFDAELPNPKQIETLRDFLLQKTKEHGIPPGNIHPHRKFATYKSCYGSRLADDWARNLITNTKGATMFFQVTGTQAIWAAVEGVWVYITNFADWQKDWPNGKLLHISQAEFDQFPKAKNTIK